MTEGPIIYSIDIGDSLVRGGVFVDGAATEVTRTITPRATREKSGEESLLDELAAMVAQIASVHPPMDALAVSASGIMTLKSVPGIRSYGPFRDHELFVMAPNIDGLKYMPLVSKLEQLGFGVPVHVENDCNAALRSATELEEAVCVNLGAGLGAAVMRNSRIEHVAGTWSCHEIGHGMRYQLPEVVTRQCHCGTIGCLEAAIGGWAMADRYRTRPEDALPEIYAAMKEDVIEFLPPAIAETIRLTGIHKLIMSGKGAVGYSQNSDFLDRIRIATEAELNDGQTVEVDLMNLGEVAELQGVALALLDYEVLVTSAEGNV